MKSKYAVVKNNQEKYQRYHKYMDRLKKARENGFYLEGVFILYAMMEDRLSAFLFHAGVTNSQRTQMTSTQPIKSLIREILEIEDGKGIQIQKIGNKIKSARMILQWSQGYKPDDSARDYLAELHRQVQRSARREELPAALDCLQEWCDSRNELVHALLNKNLENQEELFHRLVEEGCVLSRKLDNFVRSFKVRNSIRQKFNIQ